MHPVVVISRTASADAYRYSRFAIGSRRVLDRLQPTHVVETEPTPVGAPARALTPAEVEQFRTEPRALLQ